MTRISGPFVLDTNVVVAALVTNGLCHELLRRTVRARLLVTSTPLLDELAATLRRKFAVGPATTAFLSLFRESILIAEPAALPTPVCRDPDDDMVLATAVAARARAIVTGDQDLLVLQSYDGIRIIPPRAALEYLDRRPR